jgi:hypothetical protein
VQILVNFLRLLIRFFVVDVETALPKDSNPSMDKKKPKNEESGEKETKHRSVLQAKLTKVTIQISYFGKFLFFFFCWFCKNN